MSDDPLVRVAYVRGYSDGLGGVTFTDGVSTPTARVRAVRIATALGGRVIEPGDPPWPDDVPPPVAVHSAPDAPDLAAPLVATAPPDAPGVSVAHPAPPAPSPSARTRR